MTNHGSTRSPDRESLDFRGQLGRFRLNPSVSSAPLASPPGSLASIVTQGPTQFREESIATQTPSLKSATLSSHASTRHSPDAVSHMAVSISGAESHSSKSKRVSTACEFCRRRKKKCDFRYPNCSACSRAGVVCTVLTLGQPVAHQAIPRDQIENMQKRVEWLEQELRAKTGIDVSDTPTGAVMDDHEDVSNMWHQVPRLMAQPRAGIGLSVRDDISDRNKRNGTTTMPPLDSETLPNIAEIFRDKLENRRDSIARPAPSIIPPVRRLASWEEAESLINLYFDGIGLQYPFLNRPEFMRGMRRIYQGQPVSPEMQHSYHTTMAVAILTGSSDIHQATAFYAVARDTEAPTLQNEDLVSLQALLSIALYAISSPSGPSVWHVLGTAMKLATSLGLQKARPPTSTTKDLVEDEMGRRAWWSLYCLDRLIAATLNRPLGIADEDVTVDLPRELDDNWVEAPGTCQMAISVQVVRLRRIYSRIYRCLYNPQAQPPMDLKAIIYGFRSELDHWRRSAPVIPSALLYSTSYYDFLYYTTLLLMYRPSAQNPTPDETCIVGCGDSSVLVIQSFWDNYSAGRIKWLWLTLCHIYSAGVTILWCLEQNIRALRHGRPVLWDNEHTNRTLEAIMILLDEFVKNRKGADRLVGQFRRQSAQVLDRMSQASMERMLPATQAMSSPMDPMSLDQLFYSYNWLGEEVASFYAL